MLIVVDVGSLCSYRKAELQCMEAALQWGRVYIWFIITPATALVLWAVEMEFIKHWEMSLTSMWSRNICVWLCAWVCLGVEVSCWIWVLILLAVIISAGWFGNYSSRSNPHIHTYCIATIYLSSRSRSSAATCKRWNYITHFIVSIYRTRAAVMELPNNACVSGMPTRATSLTQIACTRRPTMGEIGDNYL